MSHSLFKGTKLHKGLTRSRKTTSVNSTLPVDSLKSCMQLTNNLKEALTWLVLFCQRKIKLLN